MTEALSRLALALADRYRIERAATHVAARHIVALRLHLNISRSGRAATEVAKGPVADESRSDVVPSCDVSRETRRGAKVNS
jgi:hypothetical protein